MHKINFSDLPTQKPPTLERLKNENLVSYKVTYISITLLVLFFIIFIFTSVGSFLSYLYLTIFVSGGFVYLIWMGYEKRNKNHFLNQISQFLTVNNFQPVRAIAPAVTSFPLVYGIGGSSRSLLEFSGRLRGNIFSVFTHSYISGSGNSRGSFAYTIFHFKIEKSLPHIVLDSRKNDGIVSSIPRYFEDKQRLELEGDFNKYFDFFAPEGYEIEALDILSPDFMAMLLDFHTPFDVEIDEHDVYIISKGINYSPQNMREMFNAADILMKRFSYKLQSWHMLAMEKRPPDLISHIDESAIRIGRFRVTTAIFTIILTAIYVTVRMIVETGEFNIFFIGGMMLFCIVVLAYFRKSNKRTQ